MIADSIIWMSIVAVAVIVLIYSVCQARRYYNNKRNKRIAFVCDQDVTYEIKKGRCKWSKKRVFVIKKLPTVDYSGKIDRRVIETFDILLSKEYSNIIQYHVYQGISKGCAFLSIWYTILGLMLTCMKSETPMNILVSGLSVLFVTISVVMMTVSKIPGCLQAWRDFDALSNKYIAEAKGIHQLEDSAAEMKATEMSNEMKKIENSIRCDTD